MLRSNVATVCILVITTLLAAGALAQLPDSIPINKPECMSWDSLYNRYLVSLNIDNDIVQVDQNGVVTMFRENIGEYITSAGIGGTTFYQSDMNQVTGFDLASGAQVFYVHIPGASYIAGAVADTSGYIYVPDMPSHTIPGAYDMIYKIRISDGNISELITTNEGLGFKPRDMVFDPVENRLVITFMAAPVYIQSVSLNDLTVTNLARFKTDYTNGMARDQFGNIYVAGYDTGIIYRYDSAFSAEPEIVSDGHNSPCNIDYNPQDHILAVPSYWGNVLEFLPMGRPKPISQVFSDVDGGDGDGILESGETVELVVSFFNTHFLPLTDVSVELIGVTGGLTITQGSASIENAPARSEVSNGGSPLRFIIPTDYVTQMDSFYLEYTYTSDYGTEVDTIGFEKSIGEVSILLVADDGATKQVDQYYREALTLVNSVYDVWNTFNGCPESTFLGKFDVVIWFTGEYRDELLSADEIAAIKSYLEQGGNLLLSGQGIPGQLDTADQDFLHDYLRSELIGNSFYPYLVADTGGVILDLADRVKLNGSGSAANQTVLDHIGPVNGGEAILKYYDQEDWGAVSYSGEYRLIFLAFGLEAVGDGDPPWIDRSDFFPKLLNYFDWVNPFFCCEIRADIDNSGGDPDISDLVYMVDYMFTGGPAPICRQTSDINGDLAGPDISDLVYLVDYMFTGGPAPPACL